MKHNYDKPLFLLIEVCQTDILLASGGLYDFDKGWLTPLSDDSNV